jgi:hypothetical protein
MFPEDRVLVGVIARQRDLAAARDEHWYRIPLERFTRAFDFEIIGFFLSRAFGAQNGAVRYYAPVRGVELVRRRDVLPGECRHRRADALYYRVALGPLIPKDPPVVNRTHRPIGFIYTTWDRFSAACSISELYSRGSFYVDRVYYALR